MPSPLRDSKSLADWIDLDYFRRARRPRRLKAWLAAVVLLAGTAALALTWLHPRHALLYQAGPLAPVHAPFNHDCGACHIQAFQTVARFWPGRAAATSVPDGACERCHTVPTHQPQQTFTPACAGCHREHRGRTSLTAVSDGHCTDCHADLHRLDGRPPAVANVHSFTAGHPEFALWRNAKPDPGTIRFNHQLHLKEDLRGPDGRAVQLDCLACHQPDGARRYMLPVNYEKHCAECHPLAVQVVTTAAGEPLGEALRQFARTPAPHREPPLVQAALRERFAQLAVQHPEVTAAPTQPAASRPLPWKAPLAPPATDTERAWVEQQLGYSRRLLFEGAGGCRFCHQMTPARDPGAPGLPAVAPARLPQRWLTQGRFDHDKHRALDCAACHAARTSTTSRDVLMPRVADCQSCHNTTVGWRNDCIECHQYHPRGTSFRHGTMTIPEFLGQSGEKKTKK